MKRVEFKLEYQCFPLWIYDENGILIKNDLVDEIADHLDLEQSLITLQQEFDRLFLDDGIEFRYQGFKNDEEKNQFLSKANILSSVIKDYLSDKYEYVDLIGIE
jgi:hypothetical protein